MKFFYALLILLTPTFTLASDLKGQLRPFFDTYRGFAPTDESAVGRGEMELVLNENGLKIRVATGLKIEEMQMPWDEFEGSLSEAVFGPENVLTADTSYFENAASFSLGNHGYIFSLLKTGQKLSSHYLKLLEPFGISTLPALTFINGEISAIFGPTFLYSSAQVAAGDFAAHMKNLDPESRNLIPSLSNQGKAGAPLAGVSSSTCRRALNP